MKKFRSWALTLISAIPIALHAAEPPRVPADLPLTKCSPNDVLGVLLIASIDREGDAAQQELRETNQMSKLVNSLPAGDPKEPIGKRMSVDQATKFAELSSQIWIYKLNHLAEARLQRDMTVIAQAADAEEALIRGANTLKSKGDPGGDGAGLIGLLRKAEDNDTKVPEQSVDTNVCSLDFALFARERQAMNAVQKAIGSPEMKLLLKLRQEYHVRGTLDPNDLPSPDREKAVWLLKAVGDPASRQFQAVQDWAYLRRFANVAMIEYSTFRDDILASGGAKDYDYDTTIKKFYASANSAIQHAIDAWGVINQNIKDEATKEVEEQAAMLKREASGQK